MRLKTYYATAIAMLSLLAFTATASADEHPFAKAHYVLQVSQGDPHRWVLAMNNAQNLVNHYGMDKVDVVIVAYGPGLKMLLKKNKMAKRIEALSNGAGVEFDACGNTLAHMTKKLGHKPALNPVAKIVPGGVIRIGELEGKGYAYIKP